MNKKIYLLSLASAVSALTPVASEATTVSTDAKQVEPSLPETTSAFTDQKSVVKNMDGDLFQFVIRRANDGQILAQHYSHTSHSSHASHASHYSGR